MYLIPSFCLSNVYWTPSFNSRTTAQIGEEAEISTMKEAEKLTEAIDELLKTGASDNAIFSNIEEIKEKFADYGRDRRSAIEFHLRNVERLLMPTTTTSVAMKALEVGAPDQLGVPGDYSSSDGESVSSSQSSTITPGIPTETTSTSSNPLTEAQDMSSSSSSSKSNTNKSMFEFLVRYLGVTPAQAVALRDSRKVAQELDSALAESLTMLNELKRRLTHVGEDLETEFDGVRAILTPTQVAKFGVWIAHNGACMHMLNELWSKIYQKQKPVKEEERNAEEGQEPQRLDAAGG